MSPRPNPRAAAILLSALAFLLGGGVLGVLGLGRLLAAWDPELPTRPLNAVESLISFPLTVGCFGAGMLLGTVLWFFAMRPWMPLDELEWFYTTPEIPIITPLLRRLFQRLSGRG